MDLMTAGGYRGRTYGQALRSGEFPGRPESAGAARRWATRCLAGCPAAEHAGLCVTELVTNAVVHSRSQLPGGKVRVRLLIAAGVQVRIEVRDDGPFRDAPGAAADPAHAAELAEDGRGLAIVQALSGGNAGSDGSGLHWVQLHWAPLPASLPPGPEPQAAPAVPAGSLELCASCQPGAGRAVRAAAAAVPQGGALCTAARGGAW
jgi:anti-sigma regulatory factor (Ser/Thr protein kinase)